jgi:putative DNA primase/helicase
MNVGLTLPELLTELGYTDTEHTTINTEAPGAGFTTKRTLAEHAHVPSQDVNTWYGVNPIRPDSTGRGTAKDVTRLAAVWVDIDIKPGGAADFDIARAIADDIGTMLDAYPTAITYSGHGIQPIWAIDVEDGQIHGDGDRSRAQAILKRFGRLARLAAATHEADLDSVFDLPRILRAPGSINLKDPADPKPVITLPGSGHPLTYEALDDVLDAHSIPTSDADGEILGHVISAPTDWAGADTTCGYVKTMIAGWATETPDARHPWLLACHTRLAAAHRTGCVTDSDRIEATTMINNRFAQLLTRHPARQPNPGETNEAHTWAYQRISTKTDEQTLAELGDHTHPVEPRIDATTTELIGLGTHNSTDTTAGNTALAPVADLNTWKTTRSNASSFAQSDDGNALLLVNRYRSRIRYCVDRGRWLVWNGHVWTWQSAGGGLVREFAKEVARSLPDTDKPEIRHKRHALSAPGTSNMITQAATDARITVTMDDLDSHPWELNTPGGIINLRTGALQPTDPERLHTRTTRCTPNLAADDSLWEKFLTTTFGNDTDVIGYVQRLTGYSTVGEVLEHILPFAFGSGGNGKTVFFEVISGILGDYATSSPSGFLMASGFQQHSTEIARLAGARFVTCSEVNESDRFDEAKVKELTGGDSLTARFMRQDDFTFTPTHHLWLMGNFRPAVLSGGAGFWRRVRVIPFTHTVADEDKVDDLSQKLITDHGPAVLAWVMRGAAEYAAKGLNEPDTISAATEQYATDVDTVGRFVDEECHTATGASARLLTVGTAELRKAYEQWCSDNGEQPLSGRGFTDHLKRLGVLVGKDAPRSPHKSKRVYGGISLLTHNDDDGDRGGH